MLIRNERNQDTPDPEEKLPPLELSEDKEVAMLYCPICSTRLASLKCKLVCERCGYYMSCADYY